MEELANIFSDESISMILTILRLIGYLLRKSDPLSLKKIIDICNSKYENILLKSKIEGGPQPPYKIKFMIQELDDIRNNKKKFDPLERLKPLINWIKGNPLLEGRLNQPFIDIGANELNNSLVDETWDLAIISKYSGQAQEGGRILEAIVYCLYIYIYIYIYVYIGHKWERQRRGEQTRNFS